MNEPNPITWYVSRRVELPLDVATTALDRFLAEHGRQSDRPTVRLGAAAATMAITPVPGPTRRRHASLRLDRWSPPVAVELELEPWSSRRSALGIRPRRRPPTRRARQYWSTAAAVLEWLGAELVAVAPVVPSTHARRVS